LCILPVSVSIAVLVWSPAKGMSSPDERVRYTPLQCRKEILRRAADPFDSKSFESPWCTSQSAHVFFCLEPTCISKLLSTYPFLFIVQSQVSTCIPTHCNASQLQLACTIWKASFCPWVLACARLPCDIRCPVSHVHARTVAGPSLHGAVFHCSTLHCVRDGSH
jgi:hypothetical protein